MLLILALPPAARASEPHVVATSPVRQTFAPASTTISITFEQALLPASITSASLRVFGRASGTVSGAVSFSNGDKTVTNFKDKAD